METALNGRDKEKIHTHWEFSNGKAKIISDDKQISDQRHLVQPRPLYPSRNEGSRRGL